MQNILNDLAVEVISAEQAGIHAEPAEDGTTFGENALIKARYVLENHQGQAWAMADDSGLCIKALDGAPGVFSARWAGENASSDDMVKHTLEELKDIPEHLRTAWFESAVALVSPDGQEWVFNGRIDGSIPLRPAGQPRAKLPYDVIFIPQGHAKTFAEMSDEEKNSLSHRGEAFRKLKDFLQANLSHFEN